MQCVSVVIAVNAVKDQTDNMQYKIHSLNDDEIRVKRVSCLLVPLDVPVTVGWSAAVSAYHLVDFPSYGVWILQM